MRQCLLCSTSCSCLCRLLSRFLKLFRDTPELFNISQLLILEVHLHTPTLLPGRILSLMEALAFLELLHLSPFPRPQAWLEAPYSLPPSFCSSLLPLRSTLRSPQTIHQSLRRSLACTSLADLLGCHDSSARNATLSTHSTPNRIYTSTPSAHQSRPHSPILFLHVLYLGSTNPFSAFVSYH